MHLKLVLTCPKTFLIPVLKIFVGLYLALEVAYMFENILNKNTVLTSFVALGYLTPELFVVFSSGGYRESMN